MISVNKYGYRAFAEMLDCAEELDVEVSTLKNGATIVDAGVNAKGGYGAGMYLSRLCLADLADLQYIPYQLGDHTVPGIQVAIDDPVIACMASQYAGWRIIVGKYFAMGSGPARALSLDPKELYDEIGYKDSSKRRGCRQDRGEVRRRSEGSVHRSCANVLNRRISADLCPNR